VRDYGDLVLMAQAGSKAVAIAEEVGVTVVTESFADRAYLADGRLAPRGTPAAVLTDPDLVADRAVALAVHGEVIAVDESRLAVRANSICVHGDTPRAAGLARRVRQALADAGVELEPFVE
jgi:UPF0271 protein